MYQSSPHQPPYCSLYLWNKYPKRVALATNIKLNKIKKVASGSNFLNIVSNTQVVFMFPHVGGKMKIQLNRELLEKTFTSLPHILDTGGRFFLTLCKGNASKNNHHFLMCNYDIFWSYCFFVFCIKVRWPDATLSFIFLSYIIHKIIQKHTRRTISSFILVVSSVYGTSLGWPAEIGTRACLTASRLTTSWVTPHLFVKLRDVQYVLCLWKTTTVT